MLETSASSSHVRASRCAQRAVGVDRLSSCPPPARPHKRHGPAQRGFLQGRRGQHQQGNVPLTSMVPHISRRPLTWHRRAGAKLAQGEGNLFVCHQTCVHVCCSAILCCLLTPSPKKGRDRRPGDQAQAVSRCGRHAPFRSGGPRRLCARAAAAIDERPEVPVLPLGGGVAVVPVLLVAAVPSMRRRGAHCLPDCLDARALAAVRRLQDRSCASLLPQ